LKGSLHIGRVFGIDLRIHPIWLLLLGVLVLAGGSLAFWLTIVLLGVVVLHELGHSLVAKHYGVRVLDITLWPLGGMARMESIPEDTRIETAIALAGPLVNFLLAGLSLPVLFAGGMPAYLAQQFLVVNLILGTFNLVPAFPMDGGRVLRAFLGRNGDWVGATERAVKIGRVCAIAMIVLGFVPIAGRWLCMLPLVGVFVWWAGAQELVAVRMRHGLSPFGFAFQRAAAPRDAEARAWSSSAQPAPTESAPSRARRPDSNGRAFQGWTSDELDELERFPGSLQEFRERRSPSSE
jgi:Zn-dependent protease